MKYFQPEAVRVSSQKPLLVSRKIPAKVTIKCLVVDGITGEAIDAELKYSALQDEGFNHQILVTKNGANIDPSEDKLIKLEVSKEGYITRNQKIDLSNQNSLDKGILKILVDPIRVNTRISMDPIFFMRGNDRILSGSYSELDRLAQILEQHSNIQVNINGHTDNIGDSWALYQLSENRAIAVKRYMVQSGIPSFRIKTKGYGPSKPITDNSSEDQRAKNRRVEVVITKT
ncbi:MAG: OmpA family protein [Saprospiraceae bacterium]|nr:OmpA family protein [Saprospiraceae bacterium]